MFQPVSQFHRNRRMEVPPIPEYGALRIATQRLILRALRIDDFGAYAQMLSDPATVASTCGETTGSEAIWRRLLWNLGHWSALRYGLFAVVEKASGRLVGEVGFGDFRRRLGPEFDNFPEASWTIAGWAQGQGYGTEAASAAIGWVESHLAVERTVCLIDPEHGDSRRLAQKLGYLPFAERNYRGRPVSLQTRLFSRGSA